MNKFSRIIKTFSFNRLAHNIWYIIKNDLEKKEEDLIYQIKDEVLEECALELDDIKKQDILKLNILNGPDTLEKLKNEPKSFSRLGDGEIHIIEGKDQPFQEYDPLLARKMVDILSKSRDDVYVGLNMLILCLQTILPNVTAVFTESEALITAVFSQVYVI